MSDGSKRSLWPVATVFLAAIGVVGVPLAYVVITWSRAAAHAPGAMAETFSRAAADAVRPKLSVNEIVVNSIQDLHKESKLVVFSADVSADVTRAEGSSSWGIYWGTNTARVAVKNAHTQYVIDLNRLETSDFFYNPEARMLTVSLPRPHLDSSMIVIDPGAIQTMDLRGGWARFDKYETRDHAFAELRPKIATQAQAPFIRELADAAGIETTTRFLEPMASTLARDGVTLRVTYKD